MFFRPHPPIIAPEPYNAAVHPADVDFPHARRDAGRRKAVSIRCSRMRSRTWRGPNAYDEHNPLDLVAADDLEIRQMRATYYGLIAEMDHHLGRVIAHLKETGQYERTLIIVTSDHAEMLGDHYVWGKEIYFDGSFHVPLVIRDPRPEADEARGTKVTSFSEAIDVMPTILDWLGARHPAKLRRALAAAVPHGRNAAGHWRDAVFFEHDFRNVRSQRVGDGARPLLRRMLLCGDPR